LFAAKIADYVGADAASAVLRLDVGQTTDFIPISGGAIVLKLVAAEGESAAPFEQIRAMALTRWRQERDSKALRDYIDGLRAQADIVMPK